MPLHIAVDFVDRNTTHLLLGKNTGHSTSEPAHWQKTSDSPENGRQKAWDGVVRTTAKNGTEGATSSTAEAWGECQLWLCCGLGLEREKKTYRRRKC